MKREELYKELKMSYYELQEYLLQKYGGAQGNYFLTSECRSKNKKNSRTSEGLYCHHMDEDKGGNLSEPVSAKRQPFEWQYRERLVYCNILEHLILHIKIAVLRQPGPLKVPKDIERFFTTGGIFMICQSINDMFMADDTSESKRKQCFEEVKENYDDYIWLLRILLKYISTSYSGDKNRRAVITRGTQLIGSTGKLEILDYSERLRMKP